MNNPINPDKSTTTLELNILDYISRINAIDQYGLRYAFLLLLRNFYSDNSQFSSLVSYFPEAMKKFTCSSPVDDPENKMNSILKVELSHTATVDSPDKRDYLAVNQQPAIFIDVGDINYTPAGILSNSLAYDLESGNHSQGSLADCQITISHYSESYDTASILAQLTSSYFLVLRKPLMAKLDLKQLDLVKTAAPQPASESFSSTAEKLYKADVVLNLKFLAQWNTIPESVKIKKFTIKLNTQPSS